jgi:uncharacterized protein (DUF1330 family)
VPFPDDRRAIEPDAAQIEALTSAEADDAPVIMLNLLRYREQAAYPAGFDAAPCSGREAYGRYAAVALATVAEAGGRVLWGGTARASVIAPPGERWDDVFLVEYPSRRAFLAMVVRPDYLAVAPHRTAALADSRLIETTSLGDLTADGR